MEVSRTYPREIEKLREHFLSEIEKVKAQYVESVEGRPETATATEIARLAVRVPRNAKEAHEMQQRYQAEIKPFVDGLIYCEGFAIIRYTVPNAITTTAPS